MLALALIPAGLAFPGARHSTAIASHPKARAIVRASHSRRHDRSQAARWNHDGLQRCDRGRGIRHYPTNCITRSKTADRERHRYRWSFQTCIDHACLQVGAWGERGGDELLKRNVEIFDNDLPTAIVETGDAVTVDLAFLRVTCTKLGQGADDADRLFRIPDPDAQKLWQSFLSQAHGASEDCLKAIDNMGGLGRPGRQGDPSDPLALSLPALFRARSSFVAVLARITEDVAAGLRQS